MKLEERLRQADLNDMFAQRLNYEKHRKKLEELEHRKSYLIQSQSNRIHQLESIKVRKHNSFVKEMINRNSDIGRENGRIYERLSYTRQSKPQSQNSSKELQPQQINPFRRKQIVDTHRENLRMSLRLKSLVSSINTKRIEEQYQKSNKIKSRISRYESTGDTQKKLPKSQKFLNISMSRSNHSVRESKNKSQARKDDQTATHSIPVQARSLRNRILTGKLLTNPVDVDKRGSRNIFQRSIDAKPRTVASFYKPEDIVRNRIGASNTMMSYRRTKVQGLDRSGLLNRTSNQKDQSRSRSKSQDKKLNSLSFFATEIVRTKNSKEYSLKKTNIERD